MTDDLRTRIARLVEDHDVERDGVNYWKCTCGDKFYLSQDQYRSWQEHLADAVIEELGLEVDNTYRSADGTRAYTEVFGFFSEEMGGQR